MSVEGFYQCIRDKDPREPHEDSRASVERPADRLLLKMADRLPESLGAERTRCRRARTAEGEATAR